MKILISILFCAALISCKKEPQPACYVCTLEKNEVKIDLSQTKTYTTSETCNYTSETIKDYEKANSFKYKNIYTYINTMRCVEK